MLVSDSPEGSRWGTLRTDFEVLAVVRTLTSATRLLDVLPLLRPEHGIQVSFTINPGSAFANGLPEYLGSLGVRVLSWAEATSRRFDLAVAAAVHADMRHLDAPLVVMPHGAGYNRLVPASTGDGESPAGLSRRELTHDGRVFPAAIGLSHEEQWELLARTCPEALPVSVVIGDPCFHRIVLSLSRRRRYRQPFGAVHGRRLVVVSSTWSEHSLLGRHPELPLRLIGELPVDEFVVAVVLHPNVWSYHGPFNVRDRLLADALDAGLLIVPPERGWQAALIAADWVVGDHGSVSFYGAGLDRVTLLAATGEGEVDPASPTAAFAREAPRLDPDGDLYAQLLRTAEEHKPGALHPITARSLGAIGESPRLLRDLLYAQLGLPPSAEEPVVRPVADPRPEFGGGPTRWDATGSVVPAEATASTRATATVTVRRFPVLPGHDEARGFYAVTADEVDLRRRAGAEVVVRTDPFAEPAAPAWAAETAGELPGLSVAVAALDEGRHLVRLRGGILLEASTVRAWGTNRPWLDPVVLGCALHLWAMAGGHPTTLREGIRIRTGEREVEVAFTMETPGPGTGSSRG
ncbi:hypothetical protein ACWGR4_41130 [Embleya sp. NPDC055664]